MLKITRTLLAILLPVAVLFTAASAAAARPALTSVDHGGAFSGADETLTPATMNLPGRVIQVASSNSDQYALLAGGTVYAWGLGSHGELGDGQAANSFNQAVQVQFPAGVSIAYLPGDAMPYDTALAVDTTGHVWGWGYNRDGELCLGNTTQYMTPVELPLTGVTALAGAGSHASYLSDRTVYSCGSNRDGQTGLGTMTGAALTPQPVTGLDGQDVTSLYASYADTGALTASGSYWDWGLGGGGQLGDGQTANSDVPVRVALPALVTQAAVGGSLPGNGQTLVLAGRVVYAWGSDSWGQLGDGQTSQAQPAPEVISPPDGVTYAALATGGETSYAVSTAGDVYAWGCGAQGETGTGGTPGKVLVPTLMDSGVGPSPADISATAQDYVLAA